MTQEHKDRTLDVITHIIGVFSSFVGALVIYLLTKDRRIKKHATHALNWQISLGIYTVVLLTISSLFALIMAATPRAVLLFPFSTVLSLLPLLNMVLCIVAAVKAYNGRYWKYPLAINILELIGIHNVKEAEREVKKAAREVKREIKKELGKEKKKNPKAKKKSAKSNQKKQ